ncbi:hypothetical protein ACCT07_04610 [Rhizobium johnstonii]|uniref:hypothetical protein n=1 Tax=Rhizobium johnstonii TaxID=3019933 RepID=UPI003F94904A
MGVIIAKQRSLFKFYPERRWAEALSDGQMLFRALSYYRDYEDDGVRGDPFEGSSTYRPDGGLVMTNHTQRTVQTLVDHSVFSTTNQDEIFVFCLSRGMADELWTRFEATACVEITDPALFCARVQAALPPPAAFIGRPGRQRIGGRVSYYHPSREKAARWALPDQIALTKHEDFSWQNEFRLVFSRTGALEPYRTNVSLVQGEIAMPDKSDDHPSATVEVGGLRDICRVHVR